MLTGEFIKNHEKKLFFWLDRWWLLLAVFVMQGILVFVNGSCDMRSARYHNCLLYLINAIAGTLIWWMVLKKALKNPKLKIWGVLSYLSIYAISFMCMNQFFILLSKKLFAVVMSNTSIFAQIMQNIGILVITIALCTAVNELIKRSRFKFMIGK